MQPIKSSTIFFSFYGITVCVQGSPEDLDSAALPLQAFQYFRQPQPTSTDSMTPESARVPQAQIQIDLGPLPAEADRFQRPLFQFRHAAAYGWRQRLVRYTEKTAVYLTRYRSQTKCTINSTEPSLRSELLVLAINSFVGWELERRGWIRLHAATYLQSDGSTFTLFGDSGIGKSTLAVTCLQQHRPLFSDEITLIASDRTIHPYPIPIQLSDGLVRKFQLDTSRLHPFKKRLYPLKWQLPLTEGHIASDATPLSHIHSPHSALGVLYRMVVGTGLPQILEFQLRLDNLISIGCVLFWRFCFWLELMMSGKLKCRVRL